MSYKTTQLRNTNKIKLTETKPQVKPKLKTRKKQNKRETNPITNTKTQ